MPTPRSEPHSGDGLPPAQRFWAVIASGLSILMAVLDGALTSVALPSIGRDLGVTPSTSIWIVNGYQLAVTISLLPLSALGESIGYQKVFRGGVVLFLVSSIACTLATTLPELAAARILQGFAAAGIMSVNATMLRFIHPRVHLGRGIGTNAMIVATTSAIGPTVASAVLAVAHWRWLYAINIPLALIAIALTRHLPAVTGSGRPFDLRSTVMNALTFGLFIMGLDGIAHGQSAAAVTAQLAAALAAGILFVRHQSRIPAPVLPVDLLRIPLFALSITTSILSFLASMMATVSLPFRLQGPLGRTVVQTGLLMTPWPVMTACMAPIAGRLADRFPAGVLGGIGLAVMAVGLALLAALPNDASSLSIMFRMAICGIGFGLFQTPNNRAILTTAPIERAGGAGGMLSTARLLGQTTGAALVALAFAGAGSAATTTPLIVAACCAALGAMTSLSRLRIR